MLYLDILAGFFASALAAMGVGGGGLLVIYLTQGAGMEQRTAQGVNLVFFLVAAVSAMAVHLRVRKPAFRYALAFGIGGGFGAALGCILAGAVDNGFLRRAFGILLIYAGGMTVFKTVKGWLGEKQKSKPRRTRPFAEE